MNKYLSEKQEKILNKLLKIFEEYDFPIIAVLYFVALFLGVGFVWLLNQSW